MNNSDPAEEPGSASTPAAATSASSPAPVALTERLSSLDILRGIAVLGILLMNIVIFGLPQAADDNPTLYGGVTGANLVFWFTNQVLFEGKMRAIFSMLFGAGVILLTSRLERRTPSLAADIYYRRTLWLIGMGLCHFFFLSDVDILYTYGTAGLVLYPFRKLAPQRLILVGFVVLALIPVKAFLEFDEIEELRQQATAADAAKASGAALTLDQTEAQENWVSMQRGLLPSQREIDKEIAAHRAGYWELFRWRLAEAASAASARNSGTYFLDALGMMFLGMALMKLGIFSGEASTALYRILAVGGYSVGVQLNTYVALRVIQDGFDPLSTFLLRHIPYGAGRLSVALGHIGLVLVWCKCGHLPRLQQRLACVGRMALTNYLLQSVICTLVFDGHGFALFGRLERAQLVPVVVGVWILELLISSWWLRFFQFGPVEWAWRSLTYWKRQPLLAKEAIIAASEPDRTSGAR